MLRATAACHVWTSELQKVARECGVLRILTYKCASRHSGVQFSTSELQKVVRDCGVLCILTCKCASRHSGVQFFDIRTSKSGPGLWCFVHFDLQMCFAPQRRAIFADRNFKNGSRLRCFVHFHFHMCFSPQRRAIFHLFAEQLPPHPPL